MKSTFRILFFIFIPLYSFGQYIQNDKKVIFKNKVKSLIVSTDSINQGCPVDYYEYDNHGNKTMFALGITTYREYYLYNTYDKIIHEYSVFAHGQLNDTINHIEYVYNKRRALKYAIIHTYEENTIKIDTIEPNAFKDQADESIVYSRGRIQSNEKDTIQRPCLGLYLGKHRIVYTYFPNGLIKSINIIPLTAEGRSDKWFFLYEFYKN